jgi:anti-sigma factor RsiW
VEQVHDYEDACTRYLLGELSEQEQAQLEEAYFTDDALFERFIAVKDDLIDAYARGALTGQSRERFEQHFLASPPRRKHVKEAREFIRSISAISTNDVVIDPTLNSLHQRSESWWRRLVPNPSILRPFVLRGALAALLLVALVGSWEIIRDFQDARTERERLQNEETAHRQQEKERGRSVVPTVNENSTGLPGGNATNINTKRPPGVAAGKQSPGPLSTQVASLYLLPFSSRGDSVSNSLLLRSDTRAVRLRLALKGDDYSRYDAVLRTVEGEEIIRRRALKAESSGAVKSVTLTLDPSLFHRRDYIVTLSGLTRGGSLEQIGDYYFRVERSAPQSTPIPTPK